MHLYPVHSYDIQSSRMTSALPWSYRQQPGYCTCTEMNCSISLYVIVFEYNILMQDSEVEQEVRICFACFLQ